jgi:hypothetical protein
MNPRSKFSQDMLKAFEDLPPDAFSKFRREAAKLGVPTEVLCMVAVREYLRTKRREQREGSSDDP